MAKKRARPEYKPTTGTTKIAKIMEVLSKLSPEELAGPEAKKALNDAKIECSTSQLSVARKRLRVHSHGSLIDHINLVKRCEVAVGGPERLREIVSLMERIRS